MNELDDEIAVVETRREAKKIAKAEAVARKEMLWVIDVLNDNPAESFKVIACLQFLCKSLEKGIPQLWHLV